MTEHVLGKIEEVRYGMGGHDDVQFGLTVVLSLQTGHVQSFRGTWQTYPESPRTLYTRQEWEQEHLSTVLFVMDLMRMAKVKDVTRLVGTPVETEINGNMLKSWRVLEEVL